MTAIETITIEQTVRIAASPETLWSFWTEPARIAEWWGSSAEVEAVPGGIFRVVMEGGTPVMRGTYTELDRPNRLVFTFGWEQNQPDQLLAPGTTRVEITLTPEADETVLVLRHFDMPATHAPDHAKGWNFYVGERLATAAADDGHTERNS